MLKSERLNQILEYTTAHRTASVTDLAELVQASEMTIRRDLAELEELKLIKRVHGGAERADRSERRLTTLSREATHSEKRYLRKEQKEQIARKALQFIEPGDTIFLGTGTTVEQLAPLLPDIRLRVVTNSLPIFGFIKDRPDFEFYLTGGSFKVSTMAFLGPMAERSLSELGLTKAFIGANAILNNQAYTSSVEAGQLQRIAYTSADQCFLLADSSKIGSRDFYSFCDLKTLDALITDDELSDDKRADLEQYCKVLS